LDKLRCSSTLLLIADAGSNPEASMLAGIAQRRSQISSSPQAIWPMKPPKEAVS
jgi:hypothetical protein